ncbi:MAG: type II toxin-antitoxin system VapB family antitoxin [Deltaproteobacteria bacterium]|nr:type II toxin-antitoxin system VapB family antitoxin [Deltaproteobacteria bacterium]
MRTTINIEDGLLERVLVLTGTRVKTRAVDCALREFVRLKAREELLQLRGKMNLSDIWQQGREEELDE